MDHVKRYARVCLFLNIGRFLGLCVSVTVFAALFVGSGSARAQENKPQSLHRDLHSVSFPTALDGWACGRRGTILHTSDGGETWTPQSSGTTYTLSSVFFVDTRNGWAVGDGGTILHTVDGGENWKKQTSPVFHEHDHIRLVENGPKMNRRTVRYV